MKPEIDKVDRSNSDFWVLSKIGAQKVSVWFLKKQALWNKTAFKRQQLRHSVLVTKGFYFPEMQCQGWSVTEIWAAWWNKSTLSLDLHGLYTNYVHFLTEISQKISWISY